MAYCINSITTTSAIYNSIIGTITITIHYTFTSFIAVETTTTADTITGVWVNTLISKLCLVLVLELILMLVVM